MIESKILVKFSDSSCQIQALKLFGSFLDLYQSLVAVCAIRCVHLLKGKTVTLKIKTVTFEVRTRAQTLAQFTNDSQQINLAASRLLRTEIDNSAPKPLELRLMGQ